ncbi:MAG: hypothetical protein U0838_16415 [Chloroflexota bacterium]
MQENVHVDQHAHGGAGGDGAAREVLGGPDGIDGHRDGGVAGEGGDAREFGVADHLVGDEEIIDPGREHGFRLAHGRARDADRGAAELAPRELRGPVGLDVGPDRLPRPLEELCHGVDVRVEDVEVDHECGSRERRRAHLGLRGERPHLRHPLIA